MLLLEGVWLGFLAKGFYDAHLGALRASAVFWPAAGLFYAMYITAIVRFAVIGTRDRGQAFRRGAQLGMVAYSTYELTNWAVIEGWPAALVPFDIAWGIGLTGAAGWVGKIIYSKWLGQRL